MGGRAVLNAGASDDELARIAAVQRRTLFGALEPELTGDERLALDFGCGPGRFTPELARLIGGRAVGVDPVAALLDLAPRDPAVDYRVMSPGRIPLGEGEADLVWVCLVLGGVTESDVLRQTVTEIQRVLAPGGILLLAECTNEKPNVSYWHYRSAEDYKRMFPSVGLVERGHYNELENTVTVLVGRRATP